LNSNRCSFQQAAISSKNEFLGPQPVAPNALANTAVAPILSDCLGPIQNAARFTLSAAGSQAVEHDQAVAPIERARCPTGNMSLGKIGQQDAAQIHQVQDRSLQQTRAARYDCEPYRFSDNVSARNRQLKNEAVAAEQYMLVARWIDENVLDSRYGRKKECFPI
jgi:hypothetical protein